jgi:hypothetical protein
MEELLVIKTCDDEKIDNFTDYILIITLSMMLHSFTPKCLNLKIEFSVYTNRESFYAKLNEFFLS